MRGWTAKTSPAAVNRANPTTGSIPAVSTMSRFPGVDAARSAFVPSPARSLPEMPA